MDKSQANFKQDRYALYQDEYEFLEDMWECLARIDDLIRYLPRRGHGPTLESNKSYDLRLRLTSLPRAFRDGLEKGVGKFGIATLTGKTPDTIRAIEKDMDGQGHNLDAVVSTALMLLLKQSCCVLLATIDESKKISLNPISVDSIRNSLEDKANKSQLLTVESVHTEADDYDVKLIPFFREYRGDLLRVWRMADEGKLELVEETTLTLADGAPRGEVFAVWLSIDPTAPPWLPIAPAFMSLGKDCLLQMHKISELNRAETITNVQFVKRTHPEGVNPNEPQPDIPIDPECVIEIPFGGKVEIDEPAGNALASTHERNNDRQAMMDKAVDSWLMEKVRTATESALSDDALRSRLEIIAKVVESGFAKAFVFLMRLADRRFNPDTDDAGGISLSATAYNQVTDEEMRQATQDFLAGALSVPDITTIKRQQWKSRGYDLAEENTSIIANGNGQVLPPSEIILEG